MQFLYRSLYVYNIVVYLDTTKKSKNERKTKQGGRVEGITMSALKE